MQTETLLVMNSGSSSLRYDVFDLDTAATPRRTGSGHVDEIEPADQTAALEKALDELAADGGSRQPVAVGHRIVHGGDRPAGATLVDADVEADIERLGALAPLHNPAGLAGIRAVHDRWPDVPQYAVFDTSFHRTLPPTAATYAVPTDLAMRHGIRRWGFHGISHQHVTHVSAAWLQIPLSAVRLVICHIGNGVSITAVRDGQSIETSMGFTPLEGAVMGSRSGDVDPAMVPFLVREAGLSVDDVEGLLLRDSGLKGLCGDSDLRRVRARADGGDEAARLALDVYAHRLRGYVGAYLAHLPEPHALVFTAGVGENDPELREEVVGPLGHLGLRIDPKRNNATVGPTQPTRVDDGRGPIPLLVVPTDEALEIATQVRSALLGPVAE